MIIVILLLIIILILLFKSSSSGGSNSTGGLITFVVFCLICAIVVKFSLPVWVAIVLIAVFPFALFYMAIKMRKKM